MKNRDITICTSIVKERIKSLLKKGRAISKPCNGKTSFKDINNLFDDSLPFIILCTKYSDCSTL